MSQSYRRIRTIAIPGKQFSIKELVNIFGEQKCRHSHTCKILHEYGRTIPVSTEKIEDEEYS